MLLIEHLLAGLPLCIPSCAYIYCCVSLTIFPDNFAGCIIQKLQPVDMYFSKVKVNVEGKVKVKFCLL